MPAWLHKKKRPKHVRPDAHKHTPGKQQWKKVKVKKAHSPENLVKWAEYLYETNPKLRYHMEVKVGSDRATSVLAIANALQYQEKRAAVRHAITRVLAHRTKAAMGNTMGLGADTSIGPGSVPTTTRQEVIGKPSYAMGKMSDMDKTALCRAVAEGMSKQAYKGTLYGALGGAGIGALLNALREPKRDRGESKLSQLLYGGLAGGLGGGALGMAYDNAQPAHAHYESPSSGGSDQDYLREWMEERGLDPDYDLAPGKTRKKPGYQWEPDESHVSLPEGQDKTAANLSEYVKSLGGNPNLAMAGTAAGLGTLAGGIYGLARDPEEDETRGGNALRAALLSGLLSGGLGYGASRLPDIAKWRAENLPITQAEKDRAMGRAIRGKGEDLLGRGKDFLGGLFGG